MFQKFKNLSSLIHVYKILCPKVRLCLTNMAGQVNGDEVIIDEEDAKELMFPKGNYEKILGNFRPKFLSALWP